MTRSSLVVALEKKEKVTSPADVIFASGLPIALRDPSNVVALPGAARASLCGTHLDAGRPAGPVAVQALEVCRTYAASTNPQ